MKEFLEMTQEERKEWINEENKKIKEKEDFKDRCIECDEEILGRYTKKELCKLLTSFITPVNFFFDRHSQQ
jgi:hypothetical protein